MLDSKERRGGESVRTLDSLTWVIRQAIGMAKAGRTNLGQSTTGSADISKLGEQNGPDTESKPAPLKHIFPSHRKR